MAVVAAFLRRLEVEVYPCLDNWLVPVQTGSTEQCCPDPFNCWISWNYNTEKYSPLPGPEDRVYKCYTGLISNQDLSSGLQVLGNVINCYMFELSPGHNSTKLLEAFGTCDLFYLCDPRHKTTLNGWLASVYSPNHDQLDLVVGVPSHVHTSLDGWTNPARVCIDIPFAHLQLMLTLMTDASALGWGAHLGSLQTQGLWLQKT